MKIMMVIAYDGSKFWGFQRQNNVRSVQKELENALTKLYQEEIVIKGAGRTDAKVHARYQVIHFETNKKMPYLKIKLNKMLKDIKVKKVKNVDDNFHARHSVKSKTYLYKIDLSGKRDSHYYLICKHDLQIKKMQEASKCFLDTHDFQAFVSGKREDYQTTIQKINIFKFNQVVYLKFTGYAFYRYMVRNLVGALMEVGKGKITKEVIQQMLDGKTSKRLPTSAPNGLYLVKIRY